MTTIASIRRTLALVALLALFLVPAGCRSDDDRGKSVGANPFSISVRATQVTSSSVRLAVTASFNALNTPLWRADSGVLTHFDLQSNVPSYYTDTDVTPGSTYCYMAGGSYLLLGYIYSNEECVTLPS